MGASYDFQKLIELLKSKGLDVAEQGARAALIATLDWLTDAVKTSSTPFDDVLLLVLPKLKEIALKEIDKMNGHEG